MAMPCSPAIGYFLPLSNLFPFPLSFASSNLSFFAFPEVTVPISFVFRFVFDFTGGGEIVSRGPDDGSSLPFGISPRISLVNSARSISAAENSTYQHRMRRIIPPPTIFSIPCIFSINIPHVFRSYFNFVLSPLKTCNIASSLINGISSEYV
jgi:hypothetical protein